LSGREVKEEEEETEEGGVKRKRKTRKLQSDGRESAESSISRESLAKVRTEETRGGENRRRKRVDGTERGREKGLKKRWEGKRGDLVNGAEEMERERERERNDNSE